MEGHPGTQNMLKVFQVDVIGLKEKKFMPKVLKLGYIR
jgi:hypothetical protein